MNGTSTAELNTLSLDLNCLVMALNFWEWKPLKNRTEHHTLMLAQINNAYEPIKDKGTFLGKILGKGLNNLEPQTYSLYRTLVHNTAIKFLCSRPSTGSTRGWRRNAWTDQVSGSVELSERIMGDPSWSSCWSDSMSAGVMRCTSSQSESRDADRGAKSLWLMKERIETTETYITVEYCNYQWRKV